jgi:pilus assembly protein CpaB
MMPRRSIAAIAAVLLAVFGAVVIIQYVRGADSRAQAGEDLVDVLVVTGEVAPGTPAGDLAGSVSVERVPERLLAPGAVTDLSDLGGQVNTAALVPGDQVISTRFAEPEALAPEGTVLAPEGMVEVSVSLEAQRALGAQLRAGDKVGVQITERPNGPGDNVTNYRVWRVLHEVLVTRVSGTDAADAAVPVTLTLALAPADAEDVVLGLEAQALWFSLEESAPRDTGTTDQTITATLGDDK